MKSLTWALSELKWIKFYPSFFHENIQKGFHSISFGVFWEFYENWKEKYLHNFDLWLLLMIPHVKRISSSGKDLLFWLPFMFWKQLFALLFYWCLEIRVSLKFCLPLQSLFGIMSVNLLKNNEKGCFVHTWTHSLQWIYNVEYIFTIYFRLNTNHIKNKLKQINVWPKAIYRKHNEWTCTV